MQFCNFNFSPQMTFLLSLFSECLCHLLTNFVIVQSLSCVRLFATSCTSARQASLSFTISQNLLKLLSIESVMPSNHSSFVVPFSSCPQSFPASGCFPMSWLFASDGQSVGASASASVLPMNMNSFRIDWFDLFAVQGTLKSLL